MLMRQERKAIRIRYLLDFSRELGRIRRSCKVFAKGTIKFTDVTNEYAIFEREDKDIGEKAVIIMNRSKKRLVKSLDIITGNREYKIAHGRKTDNTISTEPFGYSVIIVK